MFIIKQEMFNLFGEGNLEFYYNCFNITQYKYTNDIFHIEVFERNSQYLINVDFHNYFNKSSQCPLCFIVNSKGLSKRKRNRIHCAINFLLRNKKTANYWFTLPGFDDLGQYNRYLFYNN